MNNKQTVRVPLACNPSPDLIYQLEAWIVLGLLLFWRKTVPTDNNIYALLCARVQEIFRREWPEAEFHDETDTITAWFAIRHVCLNAIEYQNPEEAGEESYFPLTEFARDYQLDETWLFVVTLLGFLETNHLINVAIAELQAPDKEPRITAHLLCTFLNQLRADNFLVNSCFYASHNNELGFEPAKIDSELTPLDIAEHPLALEKIITLDGDAPLPLQRLHMPPAFWSILIGRKPLWSGCKKLQVRTQWPVSLAQQEQIEHIARLLESTEVREDQLLQWQKFNGVLVRGNPDSGRGNFCSYLASQMQLEPIEIPIKIWQDEPLLRTACHYAGWLPVLRPGEIIPDAQGLNPQEINHQEITHKEINDQKTPVAIIWSLEDASPFQGMLDVIIDLPAEAERKIIWQSYLQDELMSQRLAIQARLSAGSIQAIATSARQLAKRQGVAINMTHIAEARRQLGADKLRMLAQPVFRQVTADALIMPALVEQALEVVIKRALKRETLWQGLGETLQATPNPGVRALFVGESGTGKTLAASYIATRLGAPLYRVDLSAVMNKYIGESEKNLAQLLDYAAASDVVLLFDEADALFGSRSDGKETGERFANMLTNFLLTRIETHPGIVILTANSRDRIDNAFTRRLDSIVEFPLPAFEERLHLWRSHLGDRGPGEDVYRNLASYCDLAGGQLRNVVLTALVHADENCVNAANLIEGLRAEYRKQGREMPKKLEGLSV